MAENLDTQSGSFESKGEALKSSVTPIRLWLDAIELAGRQEKDWRKDAEDAEKVYEADPNEKGSAFNIYHANIETLVPAIYNSTPIPDVRRKFNDADKIAAAGADILERCLSNSIDNYDFDETMEDSAFDMVLPGRGVARVRYIVETDVVGEEPVLDKMGQPTLDPQTGVPAMQPVEDVTYQAVTCEHVPWTSFRRGPGRKWSDVPWIAFAHYYGRDALKKLSPKYGAEVPLDMRVEAEHGDGADNDRPDKEIFKRGLVWEIWDKETKKVRFIAPAFTDDYLAEVDDPLELEAFWPVPNPMRGVKVAGKLTPICEFRVYRKLIEELDDITVRIRKLIKQLKVKAIYAGIKDADMERLTDADDGDIVESSSAIAFLQSGGLDKLISWWPLDSTVKALQQLYLQREQVKQSIYEVTGISDIVRGQSNPNETLGAQEIKTQWGAIRVRRRQKTVQRFARDILRIKAEIIANKFTPKTLEAICGYKIPPEVLELFQNDKLRGYKIDIETDSTIQGDFAHNQEQMSNFVTATGNYWKGVTTPIQLGVMTKEASATIYQAFCRNFNLGKQVEDTLDMMVEQIKQKEEAEAQQPPPPDPAMEKVKMEGEAKQAELAMKKEQHGQEMQFEAEKNQQELQAEQQKMKVNLVMQREKNIQAMQANKMQIGMKREQGAMVIGAKHDQMTMNDGLARDKMAGDAEMQAQQESKEDKAVIQALAQLSQQMQAMQQQLAAMTGQAA